MTRILVWHRRDLRLADNAALTAAARDGTPIPLFVIDPRFYDERGLACDARIAFLFESLAELDDRYADRGSELTLAHGGSVERLRALLDDGVADRLYVNREVVHGHARERDETVLDWPETRAFVDDGIVHDPGPTPDSPVPRDPRVAWDEQCEAYFARDSQPRPDGSDLALDESARPGDEITLSEARDRYDIGVEKSGVPRGGRTAGVARLDRFTETIERYARAVSRPAPAERYCSRLSPYLKFGCLSYREVLQRVRRDAPDCRGREMFTDRLYWNRHYTQKLADDPRVPERAVNPVYRGLGREAHDPETHRAFTRGQTGFPMVDAAVRALRETGWITFRLRALLASVYSYLLNQWWKPGADFLYRHLIDADPAINYRQWQNQANLDGAHAVRVYDPAKQVREYDPDGEFVRRYVPELAPLPDDHLPRPEKTPLAVQRDCGVRVGETYPYPLVEYEAAAARARERHDRRHERGLRALREDPDLLRRASLAVDRRDHVLAEVDDAGTETVSRPAADPPDDSEADGADGDRQGRLDEF